MIKNGIRLIIIIDYHPVAWALASDFKQPVFRDKSSKLPYSVFRFNHITTAGNFLETILSPLSNVLDMDIGISSPAFANDDFEMRLETVAKHFELWEIVADLEQFLPVIRDKFEQLSPSYDLKYAVHAPFNDLNIASFNPATRKIALDTIKECFEVSHELGLREITMHPGHYCPAGLYAPEKVHKLSKQSVKELDKFAKNLDINVSLENMPIPNWTLCTKKDELMEYIDGTELSICFDIGHAHINGQIFEFMKVKNLFGNIHIHDNNGKRDLHRIIGTESVPFDDFMADLVAGYNKNLIIEANNLEEGVESYNNLNKMLKKY